MIKLLLALSLLLIQFDKPNNEWLGEVNVLRDEVNAQPLMINPLLVYQCSVYARKLARTRNFVHDPKLKPNVGENIAMSTDPNVNPIEIWKNSAGHYRNMVDGDFKIVGIAKASNGKETYWVMRLR